MNITGKTLLRAQSQRFHFLVKQVGQLDFFRAGNVAAAAGIVQLDAVGHQFGFIHGHAVMKLIPREPALFQGVAVGIVQRIGRIEPLPCAAVAFADLLNNVFFRAAKSFFLGGQVFQQRALHVHHINRVVFQVIIQAGFTGACQFGRCDAHNVLLK